MKMRLALACELVNVVLPTVAEPDVMIPVLYTLPDESTCRARAATIGNGSRNGR